MLHWNNGAQTSCSLCLDPWETRNHLFFACQFSANIWHSLTYKLLDAQFITHWDTILALLSETNQSQLTSFLLRYVFQVVIYSIWQEQTVEEMAIQQLIRPSCPHLQLPQSNILPQPRIHLHILSTRWCVLFFPQVGFVP